MIVEQRPHAHTQEVLDKIWHSQRPRLEAAQSVLNDLTEADILILFRYQLEAEIGAILAFSSINFDGGSMEVSIASNGISTIVSVTREAGDLAISQFADISRSLVVQDASFLKIVNKTFVMSAASLLGTLQYCRDHLDSALYLPQELRSQRLEDESRSLGISVAFLKSLAVTYRNTERSLEAVG
jgi:hypothetical protein